MEKKELQVLYIITKLELGGAQKVCLSLFEKLQNLGNAAYLISGNEGTLVDQVKNKNNVHLLPNFKREMSLKIVWSELKNFFQLIWHIRNLRKENPRLIVHTHSTKAGLIGRWAAFFARVPTRIHTVHGYHFHDHQSWPLWLISYLLEFITSFITTHYVCVSSADINYGIKLLPFFKKKSSIIRAAVAWEQFYLSAKVTTIQDKKPFVIGTVACFKKQKNIDELLQAFTHAYQKNNLLRLEILGDGILRNSFEEWINKHNLSAVITLHGWQKDVSSFMKIWHAFALTSLWEGLPCAIIEARLMKLPILAYNTGGIHDVVFNNQNGFLYAQHDWQTMADDMLKISNNKELYNRLSNHQEDLLAFHDNNMVQAHVALYASY